MSKDKIINLIIKLKKLSSNNPSVEEASLAAARMQELITEHQISMTEIDINDVEETESFECDVLHQENGPRVISWKMTLANYLARNNLCRFSYQKGNRVKNATYNIYGKPSNIQIVSYMFSYLVNEIDSLCKVEMARVKANGEYAGKSFSQSFRLGAVMAIGEKLQAARKQTFTASNETALIHVNNEEKDLRKWVDNNYRLRRGTTSINSNNASAYSKGREAGSRINLGNSGRALGNGPKMLGR